MFLSYIAPHTHTHILKPMLGLSFIASRNVHTRESCRKCSNNIYYKRPKMNIFQMRKNEHIQIDKIIEAVETRWLNQL